MSHTGHIVVWVTLLIAIPIESRAQWDPVEPAFYGGQVNELIEVADGGLIAATPRSTYRRAPDSDRWKKVHPRSIRAIVVHPSGKVFGCLWNEKTVVRSDDHGVTWDSISLLPNNCAGMTTSGSGTLFAPSFEDLSALYRSDDEGASWNRLEAPESSFTAAVGDSILLRGGYSLYRSLDLGLTWSEIQKLYDGNGFKTSFAVKGDTVFLTNAYTSPFPSPSSTVLRSDDAGSTWSEVSQIGGPFVRLCPSAGPDGRVYIRGEGDLLHFSQDGQIWTPVMPEIRYGCPGLVAHSSGTLYAGGDGVLELPVHGENWIDIGYGINETRADLRGAPDGYLYASWGDSVSFLAPGAVHWVGTRGGRSIDEIGLGGDLYSITDSLVFRSQDHGLSWIQVATLEFAVYALTAGLDGKLYLMMGGDSGYGPRSIHVSADNGSTWSPTPQSPIDPSSTSGAIAVAADGTIYVVYGSFGDGFSYSKDGGATWNLIHSEFCKGAGFENASISRAGHVLLGGTCQGWYSRDNGKTWEDVREGCSGDDCVLGLDGHLYRDLGEPDGLGRSVDGETWQSILPSPPSYCRPIVFASDGSQYCSTYTGIYHHPASPHPDPINPAPGESNQRTTVSLQWTWTVGPRYDVQVALDQDFGSIVFTDNTPHLRTDFVAPVSSQTYYWRVRAVTFDGPGEWSGPSRLLIGAEGPLAASLGRPSAEAINQPTTLSFSWRPAPEAADYRFQLATDQSMQALVVDTVGLDTTAFKVEGLDRSTHYYWRVAGVDSMDRMTFTPTRHFSTVGSAPSQVVLDQPTDGAKGVASSPKLSWQSIPGADRYHLQVGLLDTFSSPLVNDSTLSDTRYTPSEPFSYSTTYYWRVRAGLDNGGNKTTELLFGPWSETRSFTVAVGTATEGESDIPTAFALHPAYPNPFNPSTTLTYDLPQAANVKLVVFDGLGRVVESLVNSHQSLGRHTMTWGAGGVPSGVYFVRIEADDFTETRRMILTK